ncbi:hypothetical protein MKZ38_001546 [Zalerion maritima]|uniref:Nap family protein n=1 Tax=Zalerion maritima TaxID=339359 RepID=A0AAD5RRP2_9PEZI|nr:hypothetical protein MKZ38_001546 [Zalerion maritima]
MAAALEDTPVTYEELADLERQFDDVETEIIRKQFELSRPLYQKRHKIVSQIPNFWPLVIEQAPPEIDEYIQPSDSAVLLNSLSSLDVSRFELEDAGSGEPRSFSVRLEFAENDYFEDKVIEKKFWHRKGPRNWSGLVSEPVEIKWKKGKDLTGGLLSLARKAWEEENAWAKDNPGKKQPKGLTETQEALRTSLENTGIGGISFFAWFGYIGSNISEEESKKEVERRIKARGENLVDGVEKADDSKGEDKGDDGGEDEEEEDDLEIFPDGEDLAICIAEDLWPSAVKYFTHAQEQDALSDDEFEESDEEMTESPTQAGAAERPSKKQRQD